MKATEAKLLDFLKKSPQFVIPIYQRTYSWGGERSVANCGRTSCALVATMRYRPTLSAPLSMWKRGCIRYRANRLCS